MDTATDCSGDLCRSPADTIFVDVPSNAQSHPTGCEEGYRPGQRNACSLFFSLSLYIYPDYRSSVRSLHVKMSNGTGRANTRAAFVRHTGCYSQRIALAERACLNLTCNFLARNSSRQPVPTRQEVGLHWTWQVMKAYPGSDDPKRHLTSGSGIH